MGKTSPTTHPPPSLQDDTTSNPSSPSRSNPKRRRVIPPHPKSPRTRSEKRTQEVQDLELPRAKRQQTRPQSLYSQSTEPSEIGLESNLETASHRIDNYIPQNRGPHENILRISLQAFLDHLPDAGRSAIAKDIIDLEDDNGIYEYFCNLYTGLRTRSRFSWIALKRPWLTISHGIVRSRSKPSSVASSSNDRRDSHADEVSTTLDQPVPRTKGFKEGLLRRDGYRCVLTGDMDRDHWKKLGCPNDIKNMGKIEGAHIIPFSYAAWDPQRVCPRIFIKTELLTGSRTTSYRMYRAHGRFSGVVSLVLGPSALTTRKSIVYVMVLRLQTGFMKTLAHSESPLNAL